MAAAQVGTDDYALARVPASARYSWWSVATQRFGQISALSQFLLGATLGLGMSFWDAFWALTLGAVILELVAILIGVIGAREGLQTSVIARWTGFGQAGSSLIGLAIGVSLIGWFGIQSAVSAAGLSSLIGVLPTWGWSLVFGLAVTLVVLRGFHSMAWVGTLAAYLDTESSLAETAAVLGIHRNTVAARITEIQHLLGVDLDNSDERLALHLSCRTARD